MSSFPKLSIRVVGRIPSLKNRRSIIQLKDGKIVPLKSDSLTDAIYRIQEAARQAILESGNITYYPVEESFMIHVYRVDSDNVITDIDGLFSTILDSLEGIAIADDRRCFKAVLERSHDTSGFIKGGVTFIDIEPYSENPQEPNEDEKNNSMFSIPNMNQELED